MCTQDTKPLYQCKLSELLTGGLLELHKTLQIKTLYVWEVFIAARDADTQTLNLQALPPGVETHLAILPTDLEKLQATTLKVYYNISTGLTINTCNCP